MSPSLVVAVVVVVLLLIAIWAWMASARSRHEKLQSRFGPEYDRALEAAGSRKEAEHELEARARRVEAFDIRPLAADERQRFLDRWRAAQAQFVDDPSQAVSAGSRLVNEVMQARGYPVGDFEQRAADLSVDHAAVVSNYRAAQALVVRNDQRLASTEDLRQAMVHFRALFEDLLGVSDNQEHKELADERSS